jgi:hypothetical protein
MQIPKAGNIRYTPLDDLETKISAQIKQAIHLDNVTLHQQYKYQTGKKRYRNFYQKINNSAADNNTGKETTPMIAVTKKPQIVKGNLVMDIPSVLKLITVTIYSTIPLRTMQ